MDGNIQLQKEELKDESPYGLQPFLLHHVNSTTTGTVGRKDE